MPRIFKRGDRWGIDYTANGRRFRELVAPNKSMAEIILKKKLVEIAENKHLDVKRNEPIRFVNFANEYIETHLKKNVKDWVKGENHNVDFLKNFFGDKYLHEIRPFDVEKLKIAKIDTKAAPASVNKLLGCLRTMFNKAIQWEKFYGLNPVSKVKMLKLDNARTRFLEKEEIEQLLSHCKGHLKDIVEFALNTGMRKGEIFDLKWRDVDLNRGLITLLRTKNNEIRHVPINKKVEDVLYRIKKDPESPYVFVSKNGKPFNDIKKSFHTALENAKIKNFRFHDLRHSFASQLVMAGVDLNTVREILGHKDIKMTMRYSHLSCDHKKRAVMAIDGLYGTSPAQPIPLVSLTDDIPESYEIISSGT